MESIDSGNGSDRIPNRYNGSDTDRQESSTQRRRSRRDTRKNEADYPSENSSNGGRANDTRRRRRSRRRQSATQSLPPVGKPGSTTTRSTASIEDPNDITNHNSHRSVSLHRVDEKYDRRRNKSRRQRSYSNYDENDNAEDTEKNYYAQMKIGNTDIVSKKRNNVPHTRRKTTTFSRHLPAVADYKRDEYRTKRGINTNVKLPPMSQSPSGRTFSTSDPSSLSSNGSYGSRGVRKPRQLEPLEADIATFDTKKHRKRTQKLVEQRYR